MSLEQSRLDVVLPVVVHKGDLALRSRFEIDGAEARKAVELILAVYESARNQPPQ